MPLWRLSWSVFTVALAAFGLRAQDPKVESEDPAFARIRAMLKEADAAHAQEVHEDARTIVREALAACLARPDLADDLLLEVGRTAERVAELRVAHDAYAAVCDHRSRTLPDDHRDLQRARADLAFTKRLLGDLPGERALQEKVYEVFSRTLPDDHLDLQIARTSLAISKYGLGDPAGAHALFERVYEVRSRTLPDDHPDLQRSRGNLALTKRKLGDLPGAGALQEKVHEVQSRTLPDDHPDLQSARNNLALTKRDLGDLPGARALQEKVYEVQSRTLPDDHPDLQAGRNNLAITRHDLGDLPGARTLREKVYEVRNRTLPDDHPDLQDARNNLAVTKFALGDLPGALALQEKVYEVRSRTLPDDHSDLQHARHNLAVTKRDLGDLPGAHALQDKVFAVFSQTLRDDHPDLQHARHNLAVTKRDLGDLPGARALQEKVYAVRSRTLPDDHPDLQAARADLALTWAHLGHAVDAARLAAERGSAARRRLAGWVLAPRELGAMAAQESGAVDLLLTLAQGFGEIEAQPQIVSDAFGVSQALRGVQTRATRATRRARSADPQRAATLESALVLAAAEVSRVAGTPLEGEGKDLEERHRIRSEQLAGAVHEKERLERELGALAAKAGPAATTTAGAAELAAALLERSAAAAIVGFTHSAPDPEHPGRTIDEARLAALVLDRSGAVRLCPLGARVTVEDLLEKLRAQVGAGRERGLAPREGEDPLAVHKALRRAVLDPIVAAAGDIDTLWLSVDEVLELAPLDALAREDGEPLGNKLALRPLVSLFDLLESRGVEVGDEPALLAVGGLDYDKAGEVTLTVVGDAVTPPIGDTRSGRPDNFRVLPSSTTEVNAIVSYFAKTFAAERARSRTGTEASKSVLAADAPRATFVHLATHGYFAPETVKSTADVAAGRDALGGESTITGLSPLVLCGLALSGANLPPDDLGRHAGILTAEEILSLDLSRCFLVTLSACDTSLGVRRAGQGYASLRAALQGAGARYVLTSLWKVGDEAAMELMVDFYRRLWVQKQEPHAALWEAKMAARKNGAPFRDWAGWVLTGK